jgi:type I restriction enzyme S subunit
MSDLPHGWVEASLLEVGMPSTTKVNPEKFQNDTFELFSVPSYSDDQPEICQGSEIGSTKQEVQPGDVLLCKIVPHINRVWVVPEKNEYRQIASSEWIIIRNSQCDPKYLRYCLYGPDFRQVFLKDLSGIGGSLTRARPQTVQNITIPIPPFNEQRRIVAKLDNLFARTRRAREELEHIPRLVEHYKQAILAAAFRGELTKDWREQQSRVKAQKAVTREALQFERDEKRIAEGIRPKGKNRSFPVSNTDLPCLPIEWIWATFEDCSWDLTVGHVGSMKSRYVDSGIPFLRSLNVKINKIILDKLVYIDDNFHEELKKSRLAPGDLVVVRTGEPGVAAVIPDNLTEANCSDLVISRPISSLNAHYGAYYMNSEFAKNIVRSVQVGVAQQHFNVGAMSTMPLPVAPIDEQEEIVRCIKTAFSSIDKLINEASAAKHLLDHLDQSYLAKAFRGELVPQDPNDESASVLLARIREEQEAESAPAKKRRKLKEFQLRQLSYDFAEE